MSYRWAAGCVLGVLLVASIGCWGGKAPRKQLDKIDPASAGAKALEMYDTDKDGKISGAELDKCPALKEAITRIDLGGNGEITAAKVAARVQKWIDSKAARCRAISCSIKRNGKPLVGATITFIPEKFLGTAVKPAVGKSGKSGLATVSIAPPDAGIAPGFYRVVITKAGMKIPEKYSTEDGSILGQEVASDTPIPMGPTVFDLKY